VKEKLLGPALVAPPMVPPGWKRMPVMLLL
jgi:hypothetical protein